MADVSCHVTMGRDTGRQHHAFSGFKENSCGARETMKRGDKWVQHLDSCGGETRLKKKKNIFGNHYCFLPLTTPSDLFFETNGSAFGQEEIRRRSDRLARLYLSSSQYAERVKWKRVTICTSGPSICSQSILLD